MVSLIIGHKGSGKTKHLIEAVNAAYEASNGHVICIEKGEQLRYDVKPQIRLVSTEEYGIKGYDAFYGLIAGMCASDSDITDILADGTIKIGGEDMAALECFFKKVAKLAEATGTKFTFTISADKENLPASIFDVCETL